MTGEGEEMLDFKMKAWKTGQTTLKAVKQYDPLPLAEKLGFDAYVGQEALVDSFIEGFIPAQNESYNIVREVVREAN